jgi:hypothetical protein
MTTGTKKVKAKGRKIGRNKKWCESYLARGTRDKNKVARLLRHFRRNGTTDHMAVHFYNNLPARILGGFPAVTPTKSQAKRIPARVAMDPTQPTPRLGGAP